jgi:hypothetical protein
MKLFDRLVITTTLIGVVGLSIIVCSLMADSVKMHKWYENLSRTSCRLEKR